MSVALMKHGFPAVLALILVITSIAASRVIVDLRKSYISAIVWEGVRVLTPKVSPGDKLDLVYTLSVNKSCPAEVRGFLVAEDGTVPVRFPIVGGGYNRPTTVPIDSPVSVIIPTIPDRVHLPMKPGKYTYRSIATRFCPEGVEDDLSIPEAHFELVIP